MCSRGFSRLLWPSRSGAFRREYVSIARPKSSVRSFDANTKGRYHRVTTPEFDTAPGAYYGSRYYSQGPEPWTPPPRVRSFADRYHYESEPRDRRDSYRDRRDSYRDSWDPRESCHGDSRETRHRHSRHTHHRERKPRQDSWDTRRHEKEPPRHSRDADDGYIRGGERWSSSSSRSYSRSPEKRVHFDETVRCYYYPGDELRLSGSRQDYHSDPYRGPYPQSDDAYDLSPRLAAFHRNSTRIDTLSREESMRRVRHGSQRRAFGVSVDMRY